MSRFCPNCGAPLQDGSRFCTNCGRPVAQASQSRQQNPNNQGAQASNPASQTSSNWQAPNRQWPDENLSSGKSRSNHNATGTTPKKKRTGLKIFLIVALIAVLGYGAEEYIQYRKIKRVREHKHQEYKKSKDNNSSQYELPTVVLKGNGFKLEVAESDKDLEFTPVGDERVAELKQMGYNPIVTPIRVTRNGNNHVELSQCATVSFDIPKDFPKDKYDELVGVLITDEGPEYVIPDYYALKKGVVKFRTCHFSDATVDQNKDSLRKQFIENVAVNGWNNHINDEALKPKLKEKLEEYAKSLGLGEDDPMGVIVREIYEDNTILSIGSDLINAYDMEGDDIEKRIEVATETMVNEAESKVLSYLFDKLKEEETKEKKVIDELHSTGNETKYKTETEEIKSRRNKIIDILENRFAIDSVKKVSKELGGMTSFEQLYVYAKKQLKEQGKEKLKEISTNLCPYIKTVQAEAKGLEYMTKFIGTTEFNYFYKRYKAVADANNGNVSDEDWSFITIKSSTPNFWHGMTHEEIRQKLAERYQKEAEIEKRRKEATETVELIESRVDLYAKCFEKKKLDYSQRLTVVNNLLNRFRAELVDKNGNLTFIDAKTKERQNYSAEANQKWQLCEVVNVYLECYPDQQKFYTWLAKNGYYQNKLKDDFSKLDALLEKAWKPQNDPRVSIVIQETLGAESGSAKYAGRTICLGTNGKSCPGWYRNIPDDDEARDYGWSRTFPNEDSSMPLSQYKAFGRPNQVLIYKDENAYERGGAPLEAIDFVLDTTGNTTVVELNKKMMYEYYCDECYTLELVYNYIIWKDNWSTHIKFMPNGDFSITGEGNYIYDSEKDVKRNYTINGHIDQSTGEGTFTLKMTLEAEDLELRPKNSEELELGPEAYTFRYKEAYTIEYSGRAYLYRFLQNIPNLSEEYLLITTDEYGDGSINYTVKCKAHFHFTYPTWDNGSRVTREKDSYDWLEIIGH